MERGKGECTLPESWNRENSFISEDLHDEGWSGKSCNQYLGQQPGFCEEAYDADGGQCIDHHPYDKPQSAAICRNLCA